MKAENELISRWFSQSIELWFSSGASFGNHEDGLVPSDKQIEFQTVLG